MFGAFVLLNLLLAVVVSKFSQCQREIEMMQVRCVLLSARRQCAGSAHSARSCPALAINIRILLLLLLLHSLLLRLSLFLVLVLVFLRPLLPHAWFLFVGIVVLFVGIVQDESRTKALGDFSIPVLEQMSIRRRWQLAQVAAGGESLDEGHPEHGPRQRRKAAGRHDIVYASQIAQDTLARSTEAFEEVGRSLRGSGISAGEQSAEMGKGGNMNLAALHPAALLKRAVVDDERDLIYLSRIATCVACRVCVCSGAPLLRSHVALSAVYY
jgi:hypothetical protein